MNIISKTIMEIHFKFNFTLSVLYQWPITIKYKRYKAIIMIKDGSFKILFSPGNIAFGMSSQLSPNRTITGAIMGGKAGIKKAMQQVRKICIRSLYLSRTIFAIFYWAFFPE